MKDAPKIKQLNVEIPVELHRKIKATAVMNGLTLQDWVVPALQKSTAQGKRLRRLRQLKE